MLNSVDLRGTFGHEMNLEVLFQEGLHPGFHCCVGWGVVQYDVQFLLCNLYSLLLQKPEVFQAVFTVGDAGELHHWFLKYVADRAIDRLTVPSAAIDHSHHWLIPVRPSFLGVHEAVYTHFVKEYVGLIFHDKFDDLPDKLVSLVL